MTTKQAQANLYRARKIKRIRYWFRAVRRISNLEWKRYLTKASSTAAREWAEVIEMELEDYREAKLKKESENKS